MLSAEVAERLASFESLEGLEALPIDAAREVNDREAPLMFGPVEDVASVDDRVIEGAVRVRVYEPQPPARGTFVFFHGGGWAIGGVESHDGVARFLCLHGGCAVVAVDYRLAPEHRYPAGLDDAWTATVWAKEHMPQPIAVGGDSSGGNFAAVVAIRAREARLDLALQLLVYPALDLTASSAYWSGLYRGGAPASDPEVSPLLAPDLRGVAPALLLSCELDSLRVQADRHAQRLDGAGVPVEHIVYPGLIHGAWRMPGVLPGARRMLEDSAAALRRALAG